MPDEYVVALRDLRRRLISMTEMRTVAEMRHEAQKLVDYIHIRLYPPTLLHRDTGDETDR